MVELWGVNTIFSSKIDTFNSYSEKRNFSSKFSVQESRGSLQNFRASF